MKLLLIKNEKRRVSIGLVNSVIETGKHGFSESYDVVVVGGGPSGLRAAEVAAQQGAKVAVFDAKPSVGRKFLVAGRGGLNLTHAEEVSLFLTRYRSSGDSAAVQGEVSRLRWDRLFKEFGPSALRDWANGLGVETFSASTGRVYPVEMKAAPLLRRWVERLRSLGVVFRTRHRLADWFGERPVQIIFQKVPIEETQAGAAAVGSQRLPSSGPVEVEGRVLIEASAVVLALGGASWPETGSDGDWVGLMRKKAVSISPLLPANCGWEREWSPEVLEVCEGRPLKNVRTSAAGMSIRGELLVTRYGLEGGALYALSRALREMSAPVLRIDFKPDSTIQSLVKRLGSARTNLLSEACQRWRLDKTASLLLESLLPADSVSSPQAVARAVKEFDLTLLRPRCIAESISTAGGLVFSEVDQNLMLRSHPGIFVAGEMLDWDAPTGGYLMQGCFATGSLAGAAAGRWASEA